MTSHRKIHLRLPRLSSWHHPCLQVCPMPCTLHAHMLCGLLALGNICGSSLLLHCGCSTPATSCCNASALKAGRIAGHAEERSIAGQCADHGLSPRSERRQSHESKMAREGTWDPKLMLYERGISSDVFTVILQGKALICDLTNGKSAHVPSSCLLRVASVIDAAIHARGSETFLMVPSLHRQHGDAKCSLMRLLNWACYILDAF